MCVVETPERVFGITNEHVLRIYERHRAEKPDVFCQLGSGPFEPSDNVISRSKFWDLATFHIPSIALRHWGHQMFRADVRPVAPMKRGDAVILGGFPENRRSQDPGPRPKEMNIDFVSFIARVENWSEEHMSFCFDSSTWYWPQGVALEPHPDLSGVSGGPCFRLVAEEDRIELAGFIYEADSQFELLRVRQASLISAVGEIAPTPTGS